MDYITAVRAFADRHARVGTIAISCLAASLAALYFLPLTLMALARPLEGNFPVEPRAVALTFLDVDGRVIGHQGPVVGSHLRLDQMPAYLPAAFIAMEDRRFYQHHGLDVVGLSRAALADLRARKVVAGGSTITQQTAKLLFSKRERTFTRKFHEAMWAAQLEKTYTKAQLLEIYLNRIYLGSGAYGVDSAARTYFGVSAQNVTLPQAAMLAALTRAPSVFSPRRDLAFAQQRATRVLAAMVETGAIRAADAQLAATQPASLVARKSDSHSYFLDAAADEARSEIADAGISENDVRVYTTLDTGLQRSAEMTVSETVRKIGSHLKVSQAAVVVLRPNGGVAAMVGGADYERSVFNRAMQAHRQPGSAFKPFVYLAALRSGISPWDSRDDQPVNIAGYQPSNYHNAHYGRLRLDEALARSVNTVAVNLAQEVGLSNVETAAREAGIRSPLQANASLALGTNEVTPLELTSAYGVFANNGKRVTPFLVASIVAPASGKILYQHPTVQDQPVVADSVRRDMTAMLAAVVTHGTGTAAQLPGREAAGKTGTTQDYRDAWFVGFTTDYIAGVWVGNDDNSPMRNVTGGTLPAQMWRQIMIAAETNRPSLPLDRSQPPVMDVDASGTEIAQAEPVYVDDSQTEQVTVSPAYSRVANSDNLPLVSRPVAPVQQDVREAPPMRNSWNDSANSQDDQRSYRQPTRNSGYDGTGSQDDQRSYRQPSASYDPTPYNAYSAQRDDYQRRREAYLREQEYYRAPRDSGPDADYSPWRGER